MTEDQDLRIARYAAVIRAIRALKGWKQADMAERMGTTPETLSGIENGHRNAPKFVAQTCEAAGLRLSDFDTLLDIEWSSTAKLKRAEITEMAEGR